MTLDPTAIDIHVDPWQQRLRGIAVHGNTPFDVPYISQITGNLWMGGCANGLLLPDQFQHVISLYPWERYSNRHELKSRLEVRMFDRSGEPDDAQVVGLADWVNVCRADGPTLVHCQAGLNRSGLVTAAALCRDGMTSNGAIRWIREARSEACLCNESFVSYLRNRFQ